MYGQDEMNNVHGTHSIKRTLGGISTDGTCEDS